MIEPNTDYQVKSPDIPNEWDDLRVVSLTDDGKAICTMGDGQPFRLSVRFLEKSLEDGTMRENGGFK